MLLLVSKASADPKLAVHLLSYLSQDYGVAVQDGKIVSESEYAEQLDFINEVVKISNNENFSEALKNKINNLHKLIGEKSDPLLVSKVANDIKWQVIKEHGITTAPVQNPDLKHGEKIYMSECMQCHGAKGLGDGPLGKDLDPAPTNFHDKERMSAISPFQAYTTITHGVPGTGMRSYSGYSEHDRWSLAFYVHRFHLNTPTSNESPITNYEELSSLSDLEIIERYYKGEGTKDNFIANLRHNSLTRKQDSESYFSSKLQIAKDKLEQSLIEFRKNNENEAVKLALASYLQGIEPIEPLLDKKELLEIEDAFTAYRSHLRNKNTEQVITQHARISKVLNSLNSERSDSKINSVLLSFGIVFREALEAILVIVLLLSILKKLSAPEGRIWIHTGWITALSIGIILFVLIQKVLLSNMASVEKLEGYLGLFAVIVLLYVGLWFHGNSNIDQWKNFLKDTIHGQISSGKMLGLAAISFTAVFREVIETILFLKVLQLDGHGTTEIFQGVLLAAVVTLVIGVLITKFSMRLNISRLVSISTYVILSLSVVILGKSIHALQLAGIVSSSSLFSFSVPSFGVYGTLEVLGAQLGLLVCLVAYMFFKKNKVKPGV